MDYQQNLFEEEQNIDQSEHNRAEGESVDTPNSIVPPADIVAFNEQRSCADIYRMYDKKQIDINPDFQRGEVWTNRAQTLFIDSLIKQLPIPSLCISLDINTNKRLVIDGLQRITAIIKFLRTDSDWQLSKSDDVDSSISGMNVSYIKEHCISKYEMLENVSIPITVLRCDYNKQDHMEYLFQIFHRLNTGGNKLFNQEIRNCIYQGELNDLLKKLAKSEQWLNFRQIDEDKLKKSRLINEEQILRFFMLKDQHDSYNGRLAQSLNNYMRDNRNVVDQSKFKDVFEKTMNVACLINQSITSKYVIDAVLVGIEKNLSKLVSKSADEINQLYMSLLSRPEYSAENMKKSLSDAEKTRDRINVAIKIFGE